MNCSRNDVVLLPIPFTDLTSRKVRPAIIIGRNGAELQPNGNPAQVYQACSLERILRKIPKNFRLLKLPFMSRSGFEQPAKKTVITVGINNLCLQRFQQEIKFFTRFDFDFHFVATLLLGIHFRQRSGAAVRVSRNRLAGIRVFGVFRSLSQVFAD